MRVFFPGGSAIKNLPASAGGAGFDPWVGNILWRKQRLTQVLLLENPMDRGAWLVTVPGVAKESDMT